MTSFFKKNTFVQVAQHFICRYMFSRVANNLFRSLKIVLHIDASKAAERRLQNLFTLFEFCPYVIFGEHLGLCSKHIRKFSLAHADLITNRYEVGCEIHVIFHQKLDCTAQLSS